MIITLPPKTWLYVQKAETFIRVKHASTLRQRWRGGGWGEGEGGEDVEQLPT